MKQLNYIDLFAGASALSEGFKRNRLNPVAHIEIDREACLTIKTRVAYHFLKEEKNLDSYYDYTAGKISQDELYNLLPAEHSGSVINREISDESLEDIFSAIKKKIKKLSNKKLDLIVGGPPCQAYSVRGRHGVDWQNDKRVSLYVQYGKFLREFQPKVFVFENVPGLLSANDGHYFNHLKEYFKEIGYETDHRILNAKDYGVLQNRRRVIIIGWREDLKFSYPEIETINHNFTTKDIFDLSPLKAGESKLTGKYRKKANNYLSSFELRNGVDFYTQHITRPHNENDLRIYKLAIEKWSGEKIRLKYNDIPEKWRTQKNTNSFLDRFKVVDGKGISHTVIAHISKDGHYYIHPDIKQCRSVSIREAARIQSFPDDFYFEGSRTAAFRQIGNAVPPLMSVAIAKGIIRQLKNS